ncbi:MAG: peptide chain release factor 1 [Chloroflexi bacterium]|nr:peptide chain release factor 1 [Chloroflexota bacterium]
MLEKLEKLALRFAEIEELLATPEVASDPDRTSKLAKERADLQSVVVAYRQLRAMQEELVDARSLANDDDEGLAVMAREEIPALTAKVTQLEEQLKATLLPKDPNDSKNAIVEVRAGTGGDEAGLFAGDLFRMYQRYALRHGLVVELVDSNGSEQGGFKEVVFEVNGPEAFRLLKHEGGVHRVQRVPTTEAQGRIHTSTATVVVLPEADEYEFEVNPNELRIDIFHSGGAGGQNVNKVATAVRIVHIPTGIMAVCQDERSQFKNKTKAMKVMRSRLLEKELREQAEATTATRRSQVGSGERSEKVRTYNFAQDRMTDHRVNMSVHGLPEILAGQGRLDDVIEALLQDNEDYE